MPFFYYFLYFFMSNISEILHGYLTRDPKVIGAHF